MFHKTKSLFLLLVLFSASAVQGELGLSASSQVRLQADVIEYLKDQNLVMAKGQVHIQQGSINLYADSIRYDMTAQDVQAEGHVVYQDEHQEVEAKTMTFNLKAKEGKAFHIKTTSPPWISTGEEIDIKDNKVIIKNAITTTCDYLEGYRHYYMQADKITVYSGDYLVAENMVLYIGKVPVLYLPFFVKTIHDVKTPFSVSSGSTDYLGTYILLSTNYLLNPKSYGAIYGDYFFKKGIGLGIRHEIALNDYSVLSIYGYGIVEKDTGELRWESRVRGLWAFSSSFQGRIEADLPGDGNFSSDYSVARRDPSLISTNREYDISGTLTRQQFNIGLLLRRQDFADTSVYPAIETNFIRNLENLPQLTFSLFPQPLIGKNWLKYNLNINGDHTYTQADGFYVNHLSGDLGISQSLSFFQTQTLYSLATLHDVFQDVSDVGVTIGAGSAGETHSIDFQNSWTSRWSESLNSNVTYNYSQKFNNLLPTDPPHGITANILSGFMEIDLGTVLRAKTSTNYDFNAQVGTVSAHFGYLHQDIYLTGSSRFDYSLSADYSVMAQGMKDLNTVVNFKSPHDMWRFRLSGNYVDPNFTNNGFVTMGAPKTFEIAGELDMALFTNYRISLIESFDLTNAQFETRSINLYRDLHDWEAQLSYTEDPIQGKTVFFTLDLKAFPGRPLTFSDDQLNRLSAIRNQGLTGAASQFQ